MCRLSSHFLLGFTLDFLESRRVFRSKVANGGLILNRPSNTFYLIIRPPFFYLKGLTMSVQSRLSRPRVLNSIKLSTSSPIIVMSKTRKKIYPAPLVQILFHRAALVSIIGKPHCTVWCPLDVTPAVHHLHQWCAITIGSLVGAGEPVRDL